MRRPRTKKTAPEGGASCPGARHGDRYAMKVDKRVSPICSWSLRATPPTYAACYVPNGWEQPFVVTAANGEPSLAPTHRPSSMLRVHRADVSPFKTLASRAASAELLRKKLEGTGRCEADLTASPQVEIKPQFVTHGEGSKPMCPFFTRCAYLLRYRQSQQMPRLVERTAILNTKTGKLDCDISI